MHCPYKQTLNRFLKNIVISLMGGVFCVSGAWAQVIVIDEEDYVRDEDITVLKTIEALPAEITLFPVRQKNFFSGRVLLPSAKKVLNMHFSLKDEAGARYWEQNFPLPADMQARNAFEFQINVPGEIAGDYRLWVELFDAKGLSVGQGKREVVLQGFRKFHQVEGLEVDLTKESVDVSFSYQHGERDTQSVRPLVRVFRDNLITPELVQEVSRDTFVSVASDTKRDFSLTADRPQGTGRYRVQVQVIDGDGKPLTGVLEKYFFIDGAFAELTAVGYQVQNMRTREGTFSVEVFGRAKIPDGTELSAAVHVRRGEENILTQSTPLELDVRAFSGEITFVVPDMTKAFSGEIQLLADGQVVFVEAFSLSDFGVKPLTARAVAQPEAKVVVAPTRGPVLSRGTFWGWMLLLIAGCSGLLILFLYRKNRRGNGGKWFCLALIGHMVLSPLLWAADGDLPVMKWEYPINGWAYDPVSATGFEEMHFEGRVYDEITFAGHFAENGDPEQVRVRFLQQTGGSHEYQYGIVTYSITDGERYSFEIDLSQNPLPTQLEDAQWNIQVLFLYAGVWYGSDWTGTVIHDTQDPMVIFSYNPTEPADETGMVNDPIEVQVACADSGSGCTYDAGFSPFDVKGNFCDDDTQCDDEGIRFFDVCDNAGNCNTPAELSITWYDAEPPEVDSFSFVIPDEGSGDYDGTPDDEYRATGEYRADTVWQDVDSVETPDSDKYDSHACGPQSGIGKSEFYTNTDRCTQREEPCAQNSTQRGITTDGGICSGSCGEGYEVDPLDPNYCVPECSDEQFDPVHICFDIILSTDRTE